MKTLFLAVAASLALAGAAVAQPAPSATAPAVDGLRHAVPQLAAVTTDLGDGASALTYWVGRADGIHVVTTIDTRIDAAAAGGAAPGPERHAVARFAALILPGQSQVISVQRPTGAPQQALHIRRFANRLGAVVVEVERVLVPSVGAQLAPPVL